MGNFKFKFESIIGVKEIQEKRLQEAISAIDIEIEGLRYQLFVVIEERNIVNARMIDHAMKVAEYQSAKIYDSMLDNKAVSIEKMIIGLQRKKEIKKNELIEIKKEIKVFETLKENQRETFLIEEGRAELKELNEIAVRNYSRNVQ
jgi:flagellar FliJ protein